MFNPTQKVEKPYFQSSKYEVVVISILKQYYQLLDTYSDSILRIENIGFSS